MPTYQYVCTRCAHPLEAVQSFSDPALRDCPECAGSLRKVFSSVGVVFKGSGFYRNDSRGADKKDSGGADGASESTNGDTSTVKKDTGSKDATKEAAVTTAKPASSETAASKTTKAATASAAA